MLIEALREGSTSPQDGGIETDVKAPCEEHDMGSEDEIIIWILAKEIEHSETFVEPRRIARMVMGIIEDDGVIIAKEDWFMVEIDGVEFRVSDHAEAIFADFS